MLNHLSHLGTPIIIVFKDFYLREREYTSTSRGREGEGEAGSPLSMEPHVGLIPRPWDHDLNPRETLNRLSHPILIIIFIFLLRSLKHKG